MNFLATKERNYGIDLLRIFSMFLVLLLHIIGNGGIMGKIVRGTGQYNVVWILEIVAYCSVNCYALVSGFVGINSKVKYSNIVVLWLRVAFYTVGLALIYKILMPEAVNAKGIVKAFLPVITEQYWYFSAYFILFLLMPFINAAINSISKRQHGIFVILLLFICCIWEVFFESNVLNLGNGYSFIWLAILYIVGAYFGKYNIFDKVPSIFVFIGYVLTVVITGIGIWKNNYDLVSFISPTIVLGSIFLLVFFKKMRMPNWVKSGVKVVSPLVFSVYLIHTNYYVWNYWFRLRFEDYVEYSPIKLLGAILVTAFIIFMVCIAVDFVRELIFKGLKIKEGLNRLESKLLK